MYKSLRTQTLHYFARPHDRVLREPLDVPAAWRGEEMRQREDWSVSLSRIQIEEIRAGLRHAQATGKPLGDLGADDFPLPSLATDIARWRQEIRQGRGFVLVRGVPVLEWSSAQSEIFFWCLGQHLGIPGAQNPQGQLLGHVRDEGTQGDKRYYRTNKQLDVHTDTADVVGLLCLQPAKQGGLSRIVSSVAVYNELLRRKPQLVARLYQPLYFDTKGEGGVQAFAVPPCRYANGELRSFWQSDYYRSVLKFPQVPRHTAAEIELLDSYDAIANSPEFYLDMDLQPGDVQLLSNHSILHARTTFEDYPEPERRRHLLRLWLSLPERHPVKIRWLTALSYCSLVYAAARETLRSRRQRGFAPDL